MNFIVPFAVEGQRARLVQISYNGIISDTYNAGEGEADPGIFVIANPDYSVNSAGAPANAGSYVVVYGTGQGLFNPPEIDGAIMGGNLAVPLLPVTALIDGQPANVIYAGSAPGLVAGILQVNVSVPATLSPGQHTFAVGAGRWLSTQNISLFTQ